MKNFAIAVIAGDGVGQEVIPAAKQVLEAVGRRYSLVFEFKDFDWGSDYYFHHGRMMPVGGLELLRPYKAILLGAIGHVDIPDNITLNGLLLPIRRTFDQYANVRPAYLFPGVSSPLAGKKGGDIDMVVVRENTEGEYAQVGGFVHHHQPQEVAIQTAVFTRHGCERIIRHAFELAKKRGRKQKLTSIIQQVAARAESRIDPHAATHTQSQDIRSWFAALPKMGRCLRRSSRAWSETTGRANQ